MKKLLFIPLITLATFTYSQECTAVTEIEEDFSSFTAERLPQKCWTSSPNYPNAYVIPEQHLQAYSLFAVDVPIYFVSPEISEFTKDHKLSFDAYITEKTYPGTSGTVQVGTLTDNTDIESFVAVTEPFELLSSESAERYVDIKITPSTTAKFIVFKFIPRINHAALTLDNVTYKKEDGNLGVDDLKVVQKPTLYPNPVIDVLNIKYKTGVISYEIFDLTGRKVAAGKNSDRINVSNLSKGNYIINIVTKDGNTTSKFIKK